MKWILNASKVIQKNWEGKFLYLGHIYKYEKKKNAGLDFDILGEIYAFAISFKIQTKSNWVTVWRRLIEVRLTSSHQLKKMCKILHNICWKYDWSKFSVTFLIKFSLNLVKMSMFCHKHAENEKKKLKSAHRKKTSSVYIPLADIMLLIPRTHKVDINFRRNTVLLIAKFKLAARNSANKSVHICTFSFVYLYIFNQGIYVWIRIKIEIVFIWWKVRPRRMKRKTSRISECEKFKSILLETSTKR